MSTGHPLTEEQLRFVIENFRNMTNNELAKAANCSRSSVCRIQRAYKLKKSSEHYHKMGVRAGKASSVSRGGRALGITPEVIEKRVASYKQTLREERARVAFGLTQKTRAKVKLQPRRKCSQRAYLKKLGYILDEPNCVAYYTDNTTRAVRMERNWDGKRNYYKFKPYQDGDKM